MTEDNQPISHRGNSHDHDKVDSAFNSEDVKQDGLIREVRGDIANERDSRLEETGQQPLEKSRTARSDTSQRDPKLVHLCCLLFFAEETNQPYR